jgi:hypothetical protein
MVTEGLAVTRFALTILEAGVGDALILERSTLADTTGLGKPTEDPVGLPPRAGTPAEQGQREDQNSRGQDGKRTGKAASGSGKAAVW